MGTFRGSLSHKGARDCGDFRRTRCGQNCGHQGPVRACPADHGKGGGPGNSRSPAGSDSVCGRAPWGFPQWVPAPFRERKPSVSAGLKRITPREAKRRAQELIHFSGPHGRLPRVHVCLGCLLRPLLGDHARGSAADPQAASHVTLWFTLRGHLLGSCFVPWSFILIGVLLLLMLVTTGKFRGHDGGGKSSRSPLGHSRVLFRPGLAGLSFCERIAKDRGLLAHYQLAPPAFAV